MSAVTRAASARSMHTVSNISGKSFEDPRVILPGTRILGRLIGFPFRHSGNADEHSRILFRLGGIDQAVTRSGPVDWRMRISGLIRWMPSGSWLPESLSRSARAALRPTLRLAVPDGRQRGVADRRFLEVVVAVTEMSTPGTRPGGQCRSSSDGDQIVSSRRPRSASAAVRGDARRARKPPCLERGPGCASPDRPRYSPCEAR